MQNEKSSTPLPTNQDGQTINQDISDKEEVDTPENATTSTKHVGSKRTPDLSGLSSGERSSIESVCLSAKLHQGPVAYNECLKKQLNDLEGNK